MCMWWDTNAGSSHLSTMSNAGHLNSKAAFMSWLKVAMTEALYRVRYFVRSTKYNQAPTDFSPLLDSMISGGHCAPWSKVNPLDTLVPGGP